MAELQYDDVRRAVQDAVRDMQNVVYGLKTNSEDLRRGVQQLSSTNYQWGDFMNKLTSLQTQISNLESLLKTNQNSQYLLQNVQTALVDMQRRMTTMEQFIQYTYRYITAIEQERERREAGEV